MSCGSGDAQIMEPIMFITLACTQELGVTALLLKTPHTSCAKCREFKLELTESLSLSTGLHSAAPEGAIL